MIKKLVYGGNEIRISDDQDLSVLRQRIQDLLNKGETGWIEVAGKDGVYEILLSPGVPILLHTDDSASYIPLPR